MDPFVRKLKISEEIRKIHSRIRSLWHLEATKTEILKQEKDFLVTMQLEHLNRKLRILEKVNARYNQIFFHKEKIKFVTIRNQ